MLAPMHTCTPLFQIVHVLVNATDLLEPVVLIHSTSYLLLKLTSNLTLLLLVTLFECLVCHAVAVLSFTASYGKFVSSNDALCSQPIPHMRELVCLCCLSDLSLSIRDSAVKRPLQFTCDIFPVRCRNLSQVQWSTCVRLSVRKQLITSWPGDPSYQQLRYMLHFL